MHRCAQRSPRSRIRGPKRRPPRHRLRRPPPRHTPLRAHRQRRRKQQKSRSIAGLRDTPGRCCLPGSMRSSRFSVRNAAARCGSSPSSPRRRACARSSRIWVSRPRPRAWRQPVAHRCGTYPLPGRASATRRPNRRRITNSISASPGKNSSTRTRSRSSGSARAVGHRDGLGGRPGDPRHDLRCDSGAVFRLHQHAVPA